jgi:hypothetical protein
VQEVHEQQQVHATKTIQQMELHAMQLQSELKQRAFELSHMKVCAEQQGYADTKWCG